VAVVRDHPGRARLQVHHADVAFSAGHPHRVGNPRAVGREPWRVGLGHDRQLVDLFGLVRLERVRGKHEERASVFVRRIDELLAVRGQVRLTGSSSIGQTLRLLGLEEIDVVKVVKVVPALVGLAPRVIQSEAFGRIGQRCLPRDLQELLLLPLALAAFRYDPALFLQLLERLSRPLEIHEVDARPVVAVVAVKGHVLPVGAEPGRAVRFAREGDAYALAHSRLPDRVLLGHVLLFCLEPPLLVELDEGLARDLLDVAVDAEGDEVVAVVLRVGPKKLFAVAVHQPLEEVGAVEIVRRAVGPFDGSRAHLVERLELVLQGRHAHVHVPHGRVQAAAARARGLLDHGVALEHPQGLGRVGQELLAEDVVQHRHDAAPVVQVKHVGVLVDHEGQHPVVVVLERAQVGRRGGVHVDAVVGRREGDGVGVVQVVDEQELHLCLGLIAHEDDEAAPGLLGRVGQVLGHVLQSRVVGDPEMLRRDGVPLELRILDGPCRCRDQEGCGQQ
jgi:hypothetical protein